jgi:hypothetical protein
MIAAHSDYAIAVGQALPGAIAWGTHQYLFWLKTLGYHAANNAGGHIATPNKCD